MADVERNYVINLRREFIKAPLLKKSARAIRAIRSFASKHMKTKDVVISQNINNEIFKNGRKNPPPKLELRMTKKEDKTFVELASVPKELLKEKKTKKVTTVETPVENKEVAKEEIKLDKALQKEITITSK